MLETLKIPSKEIKQRLSNGNIKVNNVKVKSYDVDADIDMSGYLELSEFITMNIEFLPKFLILPKYADIKDFFGTPTLEEPQTNINKLKFLMGFVLISVSKTEHFVFFNNDTNE